jgi:folate-binding protein YgfZ
MSSTALSQRGFIRISGDDKADFLQGLITQDMRLVNPGTLLYACLLTPQGKYLADFFITQIGDDFIVDIDQSLLADTIKRLTIFKLRSKVVLEDVSSQYAVSAFWNEDKPEKELADPRAANIGWRVISDKAIAVAQDDYQLWQLQNGLPDVADFVRERTSMLEANMDLLNALSWDKGCYMGQELTARTHYRGLVKKRFLPLKFNNDILIDMDTPVEKDGKVIGHTRTQHKNYALAQLQLENLQNGDALTINGQNANVIFPSWFLPE